MGFWGVLKVIQNQSWWWLHTFVNILKTSGVCTFKMMNFMLCEFVIKKIYSIQKKKKGIYRHGRKLGKYMNRKKKIILKLIICTITIVNVLFHSGRTWPICVYVYVHMHKHTHILTYISKRFEILNRGKKVMCLPWLPPQIPSKWSM